MTPAPLFPTQPSVASPSLNASTETPPESSASGLAFTIGVTPASQAKLLESLLAQSQAMLKKLIDERAETIERDIYTWRVRFDNLFRN